MNRETAEMVRRRRELVERLAPFDASLWLGRPEGFPLARELSPAELADTMSSRFVKGGLVSHWQGKTVSAQDGNRALADAAGELEVDLYLVWTGLPLYPAEAGPVPGAEPLPDRVRAVRIFPRTHRYPPADWMLGSLCEFLAGRRLPLMIWHTEADWPGVRELALAHPDLTLVIESQYQKILYHTRPLLALMAECPNVLVETSNLVGAGLIEHMVREFGPRRLLYGSFLPVSDPLVPLGMILDADITEADKALIAGGNLRRLVEEVRT